MFVVADEVLAVVAVAGIGRLVAGVTTEVVVAVVVIVGGKVVLP